jgi:hypothetical protein
MRSAHRSTAHGRKETRNDTEGGGGGAEVRRRWGGGEAEVREHRQSTRRDRMEDDVKRCVALDRLDRLDRFEMSGRL